MNQRQARWHVELSQFDLKIEYKPGKLNVLPNILSRDPAHVFAPQDLAEYNTGTMLPPHLFALIDGNYHAFRNKVLASQKISELGKSILEAHAAGPLNKSFRSFSVIHGVIHHKGKLWVPLLQEQLEVIRAKHDHPLAGHMGRTKLIELITRDFSWKGIRPQVVKFLSSCLTCAQTKPSREKPQGFLLPLQQATSPWSSLSVDFITGLPHCEGFDSIMVVVDCYTKMAEFFPCTTSITAKEMSMLFVREVFPRHGLPVEIISDQGPQFIARFWTHFLKGLNIKPCQSSGYHPQSDGQTERVNQILEQYLRCFVPSRQDTWVSHLRLAQFAYNNASQASIGMSPFMANHGYHPRAFLGAPSHVVPAADALVESIALTRAALESNLARAIAAYKSSADDKRKEHTPLSIGDLVMVDAGNFKLPLSSRKMGPRCIGPFKVLRQINNVAYEITLPPNSRVHPVFHVSQLRKFLGEAPSVRA